MPSGATLLAAPLVGEHATVGAVVLAGDGEGRFDRDDVRLLEVMAHVGGTRLPERRPARAGGGGARADAGAARPRARACAQRHARHHRRGADTRGGRARALRPLFAVALRGRRQRMLRRGRPGRARGARGALPARSLARVRGSARAGGDRRVRGQRSRPAAGDPLPRGGAGGRGAGAAARAARRHAERAAAPQASRSQRPSSRCSRAWPCRPRSRWTVSASPASSRRASWPRSTRWCGRSRTRIFYTSGHALSIADLAPQGGPRARPGSRQPARRRARGRAARHRQDRHPVGAAAQTRSAEHRRARAHARAPRDRGAHPRAGGAPAPARAVVRFAHECWDGSGYPDGLAGEQIPLGARIISVCDAFDAMVSDRPYRGGRSAAEALVELRQRRDTVRPGCRRGVRAGRARSPLRRVDAAAKNRKAA